MECVLRTQAHIGRKWPKPWMRVNEVMYLLQVAQYVAQFENQNILWGPHNF